MIYVLGRTTIYTHHDWVIIEHHGQELGLWQCSNPWCHWHNHYQTYEEVKVVSRDPLGRFKPCPEPMVSVDYE